MTRDTRQDERYVQMQAWLDVVLPAHGAPEPASSDASFRRYFRVFSDTLSQEPGADASRIVMDAPPDKEDSRPFVEVCARLDQAGVRVPVVREQDLAQGFLLLDDLGKLTFLQALDRVDADAAYRRAIDALVSMQAVDAQTLPPYNEALLARELALFHNWYLGVHRQRVLSAAEQRDWDELCQRLIAVALAQPRTFVHRDYHSRNLMWADSGGLGVLDFQDAVHGPVTYDLVSLLRDCYVAWPAAKIDAWVDYFLQQSAAQGRSIPSRESFQRDFDWMGLQRHLKAIGIFARLNHRDGKAAYLEDIPRVLNYVREVSAQYAELAPLTRLAEQCLDA